MHNYQNDIDDQIALLQGELERLRQRREKLEETQRKLGEERSPQGSPSSRPSALAKKHPRQQPASNDSGYPYASSPATAGGTDISPIGTAGGSQRKAEVVAQPGNAMQSPYYSQQQPQRHQAAPGTESDEEAPGHGAYEQSRRTPSAARGAQDTRGRSNSSNDSSGAAQQQQPRRAQSGTPYHRAPSAAGSHVSSSGSRHRPRGSTRERDLFFDPEIPSEQQRREMLERQKQEDIYREMKEAMRKSWEEDSTLVGGYFLLKDNHKVGTFGRAPKFTPPTGMTGMYYLSRDAERMKSKVVKQEAMGKALSVSMRGRENANVNSRWNDPRGGCAPGPGTYTPRYAGLSTPSSLLTSRLH